MKTVVIAGAARTPMGGFQGVFNGIEASVLGGAAIKAALSDAGTGTVDEVLMGCVLPAGQGQAPALAKRCPQPHSTRCAARA